MGQFAAVRENYLPGIERFLSEFLSESKTVNGQACSGMTAYHLETGGKRLRALVPVRGQSA